MALKPKLTLVEVSDPATDLIVKDGTGNYAVDNPGGFGAPNPLFADLDGVILKMANLNF